VARALAPAVVLVEGVEQVFVSDKARAALATPPGGEPPNRVRKALLAEVSGCFLFLCVSKGGRGGGGLLGLVALPCTTKERWQAVVSRSTALNGPHRGRTGGGAGAKRRSAGAVYQQGAAGACLQDVAGLHPHTAAWHMPSPPAGLPPQSAVPRLRRHA
jgi:hypothetical protein